MDIRNKFPFLAPFGVVGKEEEEGEERKGTKNIRERGGGEDRRLEEIAKISAPERRRERRREERRGEER